MAVCQQIPLELTQLVPHTDWSLPLNCFRRLIFSKKAYFIKLFVLYIFKIAFSSLLHLARVHKQQFYNKVLLT